ncbi:MAG TPA: hypothetical protein VNN09_01845 [Candidatus Competibacteraceae bacterium]|nr:hypothetical protein [Candidatus Competibacteraceae bacterium]
MVGDANRLLLDLYDPKAVLRQALSAGPGWAAPSAHDYLLIWLVGLPADIDPARAAGSVLPLLFPGGSTGKGLDAQLYGLLQSVACYPRDALAGWPRRRRLRAGDRCRRPAA